MFASEAVRTLLYDVRGLDPLTFIGAAGTRGLAALLACFIPAVRAARMSPLVAMGR